MPTVYTFFNIKSKTLKRRIRHDCHQITYVPDYRITYVPDQLCIAMFLVDVSCQSPFPLAGKVAVEAVVLVGAGGVTLPNMGRQSKF